MTIALTRSGGWLQTAAAPILALVCALMLSLAPQSASAQTDYTLSGNDRLKVTVFGEDDLSGEFDLDGAGVLSFPLIGAVEASGLTARGLEQRIADRLRGDYLINPQVSVEVLNYRPFYIYGEVNSPGSYPYRAGLTVINAVALASGFTFRADEDDIEITRGENGTPAKVNPGTVVQPGDVIRVKERFF